MIARPLVSVIVPNYCHSVYLKQRIDSILYQTYDNLEILILDDASPDNGASKSVIEQYRDNPKVVSIIYNEENSGSTFIQWSKGIEQAKGDIVWIAESDDYCEPTMLDELVSQYVKYPDSVIAYTPPVEVDEKGNRASRYRKRRNTRFSFRNMHFTGMHYIMHYLVFGCSITNASAAIFSRRAARTIDAVYKSYPAAGDFMFWVLMAELGSVSIVNQQLSYFRRHTGTVTSKNDANGLNFIYDRKIFDYIDEKYSISAFRKKLVKTKYAFRIHYTEFDNDTICDEAKQVWAGLSDLSGFDILCHKIYWKIVSYFQIHL